MGNRTYTLTTLSDDDFHHLLTSLTSEDDVSDVKSFIDYDDQLICVRDRLKPDHKQELFVHELIHACAEDAGVTQDDKTESIIRAFAPRISTLMSEGLLDVIADMTGVDRILCQSYV